MRLIEKVKTSDTVRTAWKAFAPESLRRTLYHARVKSSNEAVSVVVPVYNVELYLDECVRSIVDQTHKNLEIILVNDGSSDDSGVMSERWAKADSRIRVIHQVNGGLSAARNTGLASATGKYVIFIDSDDVVPVNAFSMLVHQLNRSGSDIATGNVRRFKGSAFWAGWNQSYSHRPELYRGAIRDGVAAGVSLRDHPELLFDTTAWNKMFKREFLLAEEIQFPVGKLYEDMHPVATAYERANGIDVLFADVYNYRVRENNTSITQKRSELRNLVDKMEMVDRIYMDVSRMPGSDRMLRTLEFKVFEGDLPVYSPYLGRDPEFDRIYFQSIAKYWDATTVGVLNKTTLGKRAQVFWERRRDANTGAFAHDWISRNFFSIPIVWSHGRPRADLSGAPDSVSVLSEYGLDEMSRYMTIRTAVTETRVSSGRLLLEGYAFLDGVPTDVAVKREFFLESISGERITVPSEYSRSEWANDGWWNLAVDRESFGFSIDCALADLLGHTVQDVDASSFEREWVLKVRFEYENGADESPVFNVWRGGQIRLGGTANLTNSELVHVDWSDWKAPLTLRVRHTQHRVRRVQVTAEFVRVSISHSNDFAGRKAVLKRTWDDCEVYGQKIGTADGASEYEFDLSKIASRDSAGGHANTWKVVLSERNGVWIPASSDGLAEISSSDAAGWDLRTDSGGTSLLVDPDNALLVDSFSFEEGKWLLKGYAPSAIEADAYITMWSSNGTSHRVELQVNGDRFEILVDPAVRGHWESYDSWAMGEYNFWLRTGAGDSKFRIRASRRVVQTDLPINVWTEAFHSRWHLAADNGNISMRVGTPTRHDERGRYNKERLLRLWKDMTDDEVTPLNAIVFSSFMSRNASDSALEMSSNLSHSHPEIVQFWAVEDGSVSVPESSIKLVKRTEKWFEVLSRARYLVNNVGTIEGFGNRSFQKFVQTWHGTPIKLVGKSQLESDGFEHPAEYNRIEQESSTWDLFVAQNEFMANIARDDFGYQGEILQQGYPRNDRLVNSTEDERRKLRTQLGIDPNEQVVLYAPTWRENMSAGASSRMVEFLDFNGLMEGLNANTRILLRGHNYNAAFSKKDLSGTGVLDVTHYPDINDLIIASDLLLTDYSSIMIDYLVSRKPIVLFVPDVDEYMAFRGSYGELSEFTCGPICYDQDTLIETLNGLDGWIGNYSERSHNLRSRFVPNDDGNAAQRVVEFMLASTEQVPTTKDGA